MRTRLHLTNSWRTHTTPGLGESSTCLLVLGNSNNQSLVSHCCTSACSDLNQTRDHHGNICIYIDLYRDISSCQESGVPTKVLYLPPKVLLSTFDSAKPCTNLLRVPPVRFSVSLRYLKWNSPKLGACWVFLQQHLQQPCTTSHHEIQNKKIGSLHSPILQREVYKLEKPAIQH